MDNSKQNQCVRILAYLDKKGSITAIEALRDLGIFRLASRINELRNRQYDIRDEWVKVVNRYGEECRIKRYLKPREDKENGYRN